MLDIREEWLTAREAAKLLSNKTDFEVTDTYIRRLARDGKLETWEVNQQMYLYSKKSVEGHEMGRTKLKRRV
ncbi:MAG TPA: hypothetical protein VFV38_17265 [Ktedonobacteraceae bacterium]|nr:hypothetical protein [Ktedonobacteraceae bacterium]